MQQLHREIITSTSGQCVRRLTLIHVMTCCFRSYEVLMGAFKCGCLVGSNTIGDDLCVTHYSGVLVTVILQVLIYISSAYLRTLTRYAALETRAQRRVARTKQPTDSLLYPLLYHARPFITFSVLSEADCSRRPSNLFFSCSRHKVNGVYDRLLVHRRVRLKEKLDLNLYRLWSFET